ncbi:IS200/IS605 family accessory protein TnpB-related protein [Archaeoglobus sp.]
MVEQIREARIDFATIHGSLIPKTQEDYLRLCLLCHRFKEAVNKAIRMQLDGVKKSEGVKELRKVLNNWWYAVSAWDYAKMLKEGCKENPRHIHVKSKYLISYAKSNEQGNRNVKIDDEIVKIRDSFSKSWLNFRLDFGGRFIKAEKYTAKVVFRNGKIYLHLSIPFELFQYGVTCGKLIASFDLNSDRINMVIVDREGKIRDVKVKHFPEVTSHGFPKNEAKDIRLKSLAELLDYAYYHNVGIVLFEDLNRIKKKQFTNNPKANRKISRFAKRELLDYGITMALKRGFRVFLVNPTNTSKIAKQICKNLGLDVHCTSAYVLAQRFINFYKVPSGV